MRDCCRRDLRVSRRRVLSISVALIGVLLAVSQYAWSYFTYSDSTINAFTVGKIEVKLYESQYIRRNNRDTLIKDTLLTQVQPTGSGDDDIKADALTYESVYLTSKNQLGLIPNLNVAKGVYVENTTYNEAMVRFVIEIPDDILEKLDHSVLFNRDIIGVNKEFSYMGDEDDLADLECADHDTTNNVCVFKFATNKPLPSQTMTLGTPLQVIRLRSDVNQDFVNATVDENHVRPDSTFGVTVTAQAIQSSPNFTDLDDVWSAYEDQIATNPEQK